MPDIVDEWPMVLHPPARQGGPMSPRSAFVCLVATLCLAPPAAADQTYTAELPAGGTISTGSSVSAADPVQLTLRVVSAGTVTITKITAPTYPPVQAEKRPWFGPQFDVTFTPSGYSGRYEYESGELLIHGSQIPLGSARTVHLAQVGCEYFSSFYGRRYECPGARAPLGTVTPNGDLRVPLGPEQPGPWDFGWSGATISLYTQRDAFTVSGGLERSTIEALLQKGALSAYWHCSYECSGTQTVSVSPAAQRALGLASPVVASAALPTTGAMSSQKHDVPATRAFLTALKKKGVTYLRVLRALDMTAPGGLQPESPVSHRSGTWAYSAKRSRTSCVVIKGELSVLTRKGTKCPRPLQSTLGQVHDD